MIDAEAAVPALAANNQPLRDAAMAAGVRTSVTTLVRNGQRRSWVCLHLGLFTYALNNGVILRWTSEDAAGFGQHINGPVSNLTADKAATKEILGAAGVSTSEGRWFAADQQDKALSYGLALGGAVCIKANKGWGGKHVHPCLRRPGEMAAAFRKACRLDGGVLVERHVDGDALRFFYLHPDCVAAKLNRRPSVMGDGISSVADLVAERSSAITSRGLSLSHVPIRYGLDAHRVLSTQNLTLQSVPETGRRVFLGSVTNTSMGADSIGDVSGTHPSYWAVATAACAAFPGLKVAAVDMMIADRTQPAAVGNHWVLEINSSPNDIDFSYPWSGPSQDIAGMIVSFLQRDAVGA